MQFSSEILRRFIKTSMTDQMIVDKLNNIGFEIEKFIDYKTQLRDIVTAKIISVNKHPNADKLSVCKVDAGDKVLQIVCGCSSVKENMYVALANVGSRIPKGDFIIKKSKIRGEESYGMLCSLEELGLEESSDGIVSLATLQSNNAGVDKQIGLGIPIAEFMQLSNIIEIAVTPNRGDMMSVYGIARELSNFGCGELIDIPTLLTKVDSSGNIISRAKQIDQDISCKKPYYSACYFAKLKMQNTHSPEWLVRDMKACGLKIISAAVDITNYVSHILGSPSHIYSNNIDLDLEVLTLSEIHNKQNIQPNIDAPSSTVESDNVQFTALDHNTYTLQPKDIVIFDNKSKVVAGLAGIMGGESSMCSEQEKNGMFEMGVFDRDYIADTGQRLGIISSARQRYERGVSTDLIDAAFTYAMCLMHTICNAEIVHIQRYQAEKVQKNEAKQCRLSLTEVNKYLGLTIDAQYLQYCLKQLGCSIDSASSTDAIEATYYITMPTYRFDLHTSQDLMGEIARFYGYDKLKSLKVDPIFIPSSNISIDYKGLMSSLGYHEIITWSFMPKDKYKNFIEVTPSLLISNPISNNLCMLRPTALTNLVEAYNNNYHKKLSDAFACFEIGPSFSPNNDSSNQDNPNQTKLKDCNNTYKSSITQTTKLFAIKELTDEIYRTPVGMSDIYAEIQAIAPGSHLSSDGVEPNRYLKCFTGEAYYKIIISDMHIGHCGIISRDLLKCINPQIESKLGYFELDLDFLAKKLKSNKLNNLNTGKLDKYVHDHPVVIRNFSFVSSTNIETGLVQALMDQITAKIGAVVKDIQPCDIFTSQQDEHILGLRLWLQKSETTMTDEEINAIQEHIILLAKQFGLIIRRDA